LKVLGCEFGILGQAFLREFPCVPKVPDALSEALYREHDVGGGSRIGSVVSVAVKIHTRGIEPLALPARDPVPR
jgi:hypothetical protein